MVRFSFTDQQLRELVAAASSLDERQSGAFLPDETNASETLSTERLSAWCRILARRNWQQFQQRLDWAGLDRDTARRFLGAVRLRADAPLPAWTATLEQALSALCDELRAGTQSQRCSFLDADEPLPFEELLVSFVSVAGEKVARLAGSASHLLSKDAYAALLRDLLRTLTTCAAPSLYLEFSVYRQEMQSPFALPVEQEQDHEDRTCYQHFMAEMLQGGVLSLFQEYAALARLLARTTDLWVETTVEFLQRLETDLADIQREFGGEHDLGVVTSIQASLSDPHRGRRSVLALTFASGTRLIYKPKDTGIEEAYQNLLAWFNRQGVPLPFKLLTVLNRATHGWVEYIEHQACKHPAEARDYYQRAGMLLCLLYLLDATDCHYENLIAHGAHPVLVDMETLLHHRPRFEHEERTSNAEYLAFQQLTHSVIRSGLLPNWQVGRDKQSAYDLSGLGSFNEHDIPLEAVWERVNSDRMRLAHRTVKLPVLPNQPLLDAVPLRVEEYAEDVIAGFQLMYRFLIDQRERLLAGDGPLASLCSQQVRFLYRPTRVYSVLLRRLLAPEYLRNGAERSIQLEMLGRGVLWNDETSSETQEKPRRWFVFLAERQALEQGDVPFFAACANRAALLVAPDQAIEDCLEEPSADTLRTRLKALNDKDCDTQVRFIQASLGTQNAPELPYQPLLYVKRTAANEQQRALSAEELVEQALTIAGQIAAQAIRAPDGSAAWIAPKFLAQTERYQIQTIGYDLYDGASGTALFLAAVARITGSQQYRELALMAVQPMLQMLWRGGRRLARDIGIGGTSGLGSLIYALARLSEFLREPSLLESATQAARLITAEQIDADEALDVSSGAAGALLGLLTLYHASADPTALEQALLCGQRLLQRRVRSQAGYRTWKTAGGRSLASFAHGTAGIVYALLRLYAVTDQACLLEAAQEGIAYENSLFVADANNWLDLRQEPQPAFMATWCHGAPGIGLARLGGLAMLDNPRIREDIEIALQTTLRSEIQNLDYLCCGNLGRVEVLLAGATQLSRPEFAETAQHQTARIVERAKQNGSFALHPRLPAQFYNPGFYTGMAGIGYELLRIAYPDTLPSILLWH